MNTQSQVLQIHEADAMRSNKQILGRAIKSYKLILGFYGVELVNIDSGSLRRAENFKDRYQNLNMKIHNYLRITRILKFLGGMQELEDCSSIL